MALAAYRHLLRATRIAFQGDSMLLHSARTQARTGFNKLSSLEPGSEEATKQIAHAEGVAQVLRQNVVQGERQGDSDLLKLNIHKDTELGDNDTIKNPSGKGGKVKVAGGDGL